MDLSGIDSGSARSRRISELLEAAVESGDCEPFDIAMLDLAARMRLAGGRFRSANLDELAEVAAVIGDLAVSLAATTRWIVERGGKTS